MKRLEIFWVIITVLMCGCSVNPGKQDVGLAEGFVVIPAGSFRMGSTESLDDVEVPIHNVTIKAFAMSKTEVTIGQYRLFARETERGIPPEYEVRPDDLPMMDVNWGDAVAYAQWLSQKSGKTFRLPSEAEWEYAARAGSTTRYSWGDAPSGRHANGSESSGWPYDGYDHMSDYLVAPVGSLTPNGFGLYDMSGNAAEWVQDCWNAGYSAAPVDGSAWLTGDCSARIMRGGCVFNGPHELRSAFRLGMGALYSGMNGFRLAHDLLQNSEFNGSELLK